MPDIVQNPVAPVVTIVSPEWFTWGQSDARNALEYNARRERYALALKGQPYPTWNAFGTEYKRGAVEAGYTPAATDVLFKRNVLDALREMGIEKPKSDTSSATRPVSAETDAKRKAQEESRAKLDAMTIAQVQAEIKTCTDAARLAVLYPTLVGKEKQVERDVAKAQREACAKLRKSCVEILDTFDKATMQKAHTALVKLIAKK